MTTTLAVSDRHHITPSQAAPVRVAFLIDRLSRAGTETQLLALIHSLDRQRVEPFLVLLNGEDAESRSLEPTDCPVLRLGVSSLVGRKAWSAGRTFVRFLRERRIDVVQAYFLDSVYFGAPLAKLAGVKRVVRVRNNLGYWLTRRHRILSRVARPFIDVTLTNSEPGRDALLAEGESPRKLTVIENGVDIDRFAACRPLNLSKPIVRVGTVANLRPVKGIDVLIKAAAIVCHTDSRVRLQVAGEGEQRGELEQMIRDQNLDTAVSLPGTTSDVPGFLDSVEIAVLPSRSEGMSNALLEMMAAGRAIVATRVGGTPNIIRDGIDGLLVAPNDPAGLAAAIRRLITEPDSAQQLADSAKRRVAERYSRAAMRRQFEDLFARLSRHVD